MHVSCQERVQIYAKESTDRSFCIPNKERDFHKIGFFESLLNLLFTKLVRTNESIDKKPKI